MTIIKPDYIISERGFPMLESTMIHSRKQFDDDWFKKKFRFDLFERKSSKLLHLRPTIDDTLLSILNDRAIDNTQSYKLQKNQRNAILRFCSRSRNKGVQMFATDLDHEGF